MGERDPLYRTGRDDILARFRTITSRRDQLAHLIAGPLSRGSGLDTPGMAEHLAEYREVTAAFDALALELFG